MNHQKMLVLEKYDNNRPTPVRFDFFMEVILSTLPAHYNDSDSLFCLLCLKDIKSYMHRVL